MGGFRRLSLRGLRTNIEKKKEIKEEGLIVAKERSFLLAEVYRKGPRLLIVGVDVVLGANI